MCTYERSGVTIDRCTKCGRTFLDRGELRPRRASTSGRDGAGQYEGGYEDDPRFHRRKHRGFLGDLFDD